MGDVAGWLANVPETEHCCTLIFGLVGEAAEDEPMVIESWRTSAAAVRHHPFVVGESYADRRVLVATRSTAGRVGVVLGVGSLAAVAYSSYVEGTDSYDDEGCEVLERLVL